MTEPAVAVAFARLRAFAAAAFERLGLPAADAYTVATLMAEADLQGSDGHGIMRLPQYAKRIKAGGINTHPDIRVLQERARTRVVERLPSRRGLACSRMAQAENRGVNDMRGTVIVSFAQGREYELRITAGDKPLPAAQQGEMWLSQQFEEFGCTPRSMVGKVLTFDKVLEVARAAGEKRFASDIAWAEHYARAVLATLNREIVRVDVGENTVG